MRDVFRSCPFFMGIYVYVIFYMLMAVGIIA